MAERPPAVKLAAPLLVLLVSGCALTPADRAHRAPVEERATLPRPAAPPRPESTPPSTATSPLPPPPVAAPVPLPEPIEVRPMAPPPPRPPTEVASVPAPPAVPPLPQASPAPPAMLPTAERGLPRTPPPRNPAAAALVGQASQHVRKGELEQASASLERALRIEPDNPWLWHQLGLVRLFERQDEQAAQLAARSNALTSDPGLQARNWRLIAQSKERLGESDEARSAAARARALNGE